jgi:hypothetical protein
MQAVAKPPVFFFLEMHRPSSIYAHEGQPAIVVRAVVAVSERVPAGDADDARAERTMARRGGAFVLLVLCSLPVLLAPQAAAGATKPLVPAMFVFGDSLVDVGNNNHLRKCNDSCKANHRPYGVDYPSHSPTGRFSNGYNMADQLGTLCMHVRTLLASA